MGDIRVSVKKVLFDPKVGASVVLLKEEEGEREVPIWIGQSEALSIAMAIENISLPRPMTHDLIQSVLTGLGVSIDWIRIHDLDEGTFYATLRLNSSDGEVDVDSRPSDAIAVALRMEAPIFVAEKVFVAASQMDPNSPGKIEDMDEDFLADLPDEVFGKYKM
ncbi:MAG: bifunctional nuclease family protein [Proteobacteria bacterium]|nr:bifunctional nuclease family protein [Pseudomonadota bacterium]